MPKRSRETTRENMMHQTNTLTKRTRTSNLQVALRNVSVHRLDPLSPEWTRAMQAACAQNADVIRSMSLEELKVCASVTVEQESDKTAKEKYNLYMHTALYLSKQRKEHVAMSDSLLLAQVASNGRKLYFSELLVLLQGYVLKPSLQCIAVCTGMSLKEWDAMNHVVHHLGQAIDLDEEDSSCDSPVSTHPRTPTTTGSPGPEAKVDSTSNKRPMKGEDVTDDDDEEYKDPEQGEEEEDDEEYEDPEELEEEDDDLEMEEEEEEELDPKDAYADLADEQGNLIGFVV